MKKVLLLLLLPILAVAAVSCESEGDGSGDNTPEPYLVGYATEFAGNKCVSGYPVRINGYDFSPDASENQVIYGIGLDATSLEVTEASEQHVVFTAPEISGPSLYVRVSSRGKESNQILLSFDNSLKPDSEQPGDGEQENEEKEDNVDISALLNAAKKVQVREGIEWIEFHGTWEGQVRNINVVKVALNEHNRLGLYYDYQSVDDGYNIDDKCMHLDAIAGTNGPMACCHYVRVDGVTKRGANTQDPWIVNAAFVIDAAGVPDLLEVKDNYDAAKLEYPTIGVGGPMLVFNGQICEQKQSFKDDILPVWEKHSNWARGEFIYTTHPRTAFGISKDQKTVYLVTVDGRFTSSNTAKRAIGMPTLTLAKLMRGLGCHKAVNFDGGGGTAMYIYEQGNNGIVNHPCDTPRDWDNPTLRPCGCAVHIISDLK